MLIDLAHLSTESDQRRAALLADAENFRLARMVRSARRARRATATPPTGPPREPEAAAGAPDRSEGRVAARNDDAERRYAVPR